jgi:hypothetical protein
MFVEREFPMGKQAPKGRHYPGATCLYRRFDFPIVAVSAEPRLDRGEQTLSRPIAQPSHLKPLAVAKVCKTKNPTAVLRGSLFSLFLFRLFHRKDLEFCSAIEGVLFFKTLYVVCTTV